MNVINPEGVNPVSSWKALREETGKTGNSILPSGAMYCPQDSNGVGFSVLCFPPKIPPNIWMAAACEQDISLLHPTSRVNSFFWTRKPGLHQCKLYYLFTSGGNIWCPLKTEGGRGQAGSVPRPEKMRIRKNDDFDDFVYTRERPSVALQEWFGLTDNNSA